MKLKEQQGDGITILGSGSIIQQFASLNLIDEYTLMVNPVVLGAGKHLFKDFRKTGLKLLESRSFRNGLVYLRYQVVKLSLIQIRLQINCFHYKNARFVHKILLYCT
jgi:dihydrofolate reductase